MKIKGYTQLTLHDIDWAYPDNRGGKKWAGKTIEKAGIVNRGEMDEQMLLILFTDKTFVCITFDNYTDPDSDIEEVRLQDRWIYEYSTLKENLSNYHSHIDSNGNIQFDLWVQMLIDFGFYQLTEEEAKIIREKTIKAREEREYAEYLKLKEKYELHEQGTK